MNTTKKTTQFTRLALLAALLVVLGCTPLGFISIPPISITLMHIPVIIGSLMLGATYGGVLGLVFGLVSMLKAATSPNPADLVFSPFASGMPLASLVMCIGPRVILGILPAILNKLLLKVLKKQAINFTISACISTAVHTILVLGCLSLFFKAIRVQEIFMYIIGVNGVLEMVAAGVLATGVCVPLKKNHVI